MANGGGPACLRLRVVADPAKVDPRFMATPHKLDEIANAVAEYWPESINPGQLADPELVAAIRQARNRLLDLCELSELGR